MAARAVAPHSRMVIRKMLDRAWLYVLCATFTSVLAVAAGAASVPDAASCRAAIAAAEPGSGLPPRMLGAIGLVESGRFDPGTGTVAPWPWTINVAGADAVFASKAEAIAAVQAAQQAGVRSIDVGCMQINLLFHPRAFASLDEAFDPAANVRYAIAFLTGLHAQTGDWAEAVAAYHSETPGIGTAYAQRVAAFWPDARRYGLTAAAGWRAPAVSLADVVDPDRLLTPEFRAERIAAAAFLRQQQALAVGGPSPSGQDVRRPRRGVARPIPTMVALEAEVDPHHLLTPEFRAERIAAAVFQHQQQRTGESVLAAAE